MRTRRSPQGIGAGGPRWVQPDKQFPKLKDELHSIIKGRYWPVDKNYYYENISKTLTITNISDDGKIIEVEEEEELIIIPDKRAKFVDYRYHYKHSPSGSQKIHEFTFNGRPIKEFYDYKKEGVDDEDYVFDLPPEKYSVKRRTTKMIPLDEDSFLKSTYKTYTRGCRVNARSMVKGIGIRFVSVGTHDNFKNVVGAGTQWQDVSIMEYKGLLLPKQGWLLIFLRLNVESAAK